MFPIVTHTVGNSKSSIGPLTGSGRHLARRSVLALFKSAGNLVYNPGRRNPLVALLVLCLCCAGVLAQPLPTIELRPVYTNLSLQVPTRFEEAPDGSARIFIAEQDGRITSVKKNSDGKESAELLNIVDRKPHKDLEEGLLGLAFSPQFKSNHLFYLYYTLHDPRRSIISEFHLAQIDPPRVDMKSERVLLEVPQPFENHKAGQLSFGPDGYLYIALGDGGRGNDPFNNAQNTSSLLGKILRIDVNSRSSTTRGGVKVQLEYGIPPDNPFVNEPEFYEYGVCKEIWAYGFRNPWRFSFDIETGDLWAGDVGQDTWEEVNLVVKGGTTVGVCGRALIILNPGRKARSTATP